MLHLTLNGAPVALDVPDDAPLLLALRGPAGLSGPRFGCGAEQCGSCMVLVDGRPAHACTLPAGACRDRVVTTVEGLGTPDAPHPLQVALLAEQAGQCGYCLAGIIVSAAALLARDPDPDEATIRAALDPHLCRCGSHNRIVRAVRRAAQAMRVPSDRRRAEAQPSTEGVNRMAKSPPSDRRRAEAQPSTEGVNRMAKSPPSDRRRAEAQPSTEGVNRMANP